MTHTLKTLVALMAAACIPLAATAQHFETGGKAYNVLSEEDHTVELTMRYSGTPYSGNFTVPSTVTYGGQTYDVVALGEYAFYYATLSGVTIPSSVTRIKTKCFLFSNGPATLTIPASVTQIDDLAIAARNNTAIDVDGDNPCYCTIDGMLFSKDSTTLVRCPMGMGGTIALPQATQHVGRYAFAYCMSLTGVTLHEGISSLGYGAFMFANLLDNVVIPASVTHIGANLFARCTALDNLSVASGNSHYYMDGMMILSAGGDTLVSCHRSADTLQLPATLRVVGGVCGNTNVRYVNIPDGATTIDENAFENSTLASIDMPGSLSFIDEYAFNYCTSLTHVGLPPTLDTMGTGCFYQCTHLTSIAIPDGLRIIPMEAFFGCEALSDITWGNAVEVIDSFAFGGCAIEELLLPATLRSVRCGAFNGYYDGTLRRVAFTAPVDTIEPETFYGQHLESLRLRNTVPPVSRTTMEYGDDYGCLLDATVDTIIIPCGSLEAYISDGYWGLFADYFVEDCAGIAEAEADNLVIRVTEGYVVVESAEGEAVCLYDAAGRLLAQTVCHGTCRLPLPTAGLYLVQVDERPARKVTFAE